MKIPGRLHHHTPGWVRDGSAFHVRMRAETGVMFIGNDDEKIVARTILDAARFYHEKQRWFCRLMLIMPDHLHAILAFPSGSGMSDTIKGWKSFLSHAHGIKWQEGYFDHRLRDRKEEDECWTYIRQNPLRAGLVATAEAWPWRRWPEDAVTPE